MKTRNALLLVSTVFFAVTATAAGSHAGGHAHEGSAIGEPGQADKVTRTVQVQTEDTMRFSPANFTVTRGETIRFVVKNTGKVKHEFVLGKDKELKEHYELMKKFPEMEHAEANMVTVGPGQTGEVIWKFTKAGAVGIACLHPGHYDAGLKGAIKVVSAK